MSRFISDEAALRVALASRSLPDIELISLLGLLVQHLGEPLTEDKLAGLSPKAFRLMISSLSNTPTRKDVNEALAILMDSEVVSVDAPEIIDVPPLPSPKLTVAVTSNQGEMVNGHYGSCLRVLVYEVNASTHQLVDIRQVASHLSGEARAEHMLTLLKGCQMLFTLSIGGPAAARVTRANIHPVKKSVPEEAAVAMQSLSSVIAGNPPPWIAKLLGVATPMTLSAVEA
ncbi:NifB/NifX family molybdenum-iron cluster-binding protein [Shewanella sp.]|uniref:NifB/NifX family molybdenum-iron cluster-binding protein n=1 Tax=Shewanella sp. TaxID=50422 RepID=UPI003A983B84